MRGLLARIPVIGRLFRPPGPVSLVMLVVEKPAPSDAELFAAIKRALPLENPEVQRLPNSPGGPNAAFMVVCAGGALGIICAHDRYADAVPPVGPIGEAFAEHQAWISVDVVRDFGDAMSAVGQIAAELMPDDCVLLYQPHRHRASFPTPVMLEALRQGAWESQFDKTGKTAGMLATRPADDAELAAATAEAMARFPEFVRAFEQRDGWGHAVKTPFTERDEVEHMWVIVTSITETHVAGTLESEPQLIHGVRHGDEVTVAIDDIEDWLFMRGEEMVGGFSMAVLLRQEDA